MLLFQIPNKDNPAPQVFKCMDLSKEIANFLGDSKFNKLTN